MRLDNKKLYELLKSKKVLSLFHANTVATSTTFIQESGLLSRKDVERKGLYQTPQISDNIDKLFDVFGDIFLDTKDLHDYFCRQNHYGPVLFRFKLELLLNEEFEIWVTKDNPIYWKKHSRSGENYFQSIEDLINEWDCYDLQKKMFTVRKPVKPILFNYLEEIVLDDPKLMIRDDVVLGKESREALIKATNGNSNFRNILTWRKCGHCFCEDNYLKQLAVPELIQRFLPAYHAEFKK